MNTLNDRLDRVEAKSDRIQSENNKLNDENGQLSQAIDDMQPFAVSGRLVGDDVRCRRGARRRRQPRKAVVTAAQQADATVTGTLWLESKWALDQRRRREGAADALGSTTKNKTSAPHRGDGSSSPSA